ncbi:MAG: monovalent cation/H+ antiporter complex subunit F [Alphaproteobacteria bacterium]
MIIVIFSTIIISMILMLIAVIKGPSIFDRIMAVNCFTNYTICFVVLLANFDGNNSFIDIALIYTLINFIATIAFLKYFKHRSF